jgi:TonB family protein
MLQKIFLEIILIWIGSIINCYSEEPQAWQPARIFGENYPKDAQGAGIEGVVEAKCFIHEDGSVAKVVILKGHLLLARAVEANLIHWNFRRIDRANDAKTFVVTYKFELKGYCDYHVGCKQEFWFDYPDRITIVSERPNTVE